MSEVKMKQMVLGAIGTNSYLLCRRGAGQVLVIDPADREDRIRQEAQKLGGRVGAVLLTHGHFDHIGAAEALRREEGAPICAMEGEEALLADPEKNLSVRFGRPLSLKADKLLSDGQRIVLCGLAIQVMATPGHTAGGGCYYLPEENLLFSGDTLFAGTVGRSDLPTGSMEELVRSVREKLSALPKETLVYPGHGPATDIGTEKQMNVYLS